MEAEANDPNLSYYCVRHPPLPLLHHHRLRNETSRSNDGSRSERSKPRGKGYSSFNLHGVPLLRAHLALIWPTESHCPPKRSRSCCCRLGGRDGKHRATLGHPGYLYIYTALRMAVLRMTALPSCKFHSVPRASWGRTDLCRGALH